MISLGGLLLSVGIARLMRWRTSVRRLQSSSVRSAGNGRGWLSDLRSWLDLTFLHWPDAEIDADFRSFLIAA
jgi:hypothetical protein